MLVPLTAADEEAPAASSPEQHSPAGWLSNCLPRLCRRQALMSSSCLVRHQMKCCSTMQRERLQRFPPYSQSACVDVQLEAMPCRTRDSAPLRQLQQYLSLLWQTLAQLPGAAVTHCLVITKQAEGSCIQQRKPGSLCAGASPVTPSKESQAQTAP